MLPFPSVENQAGKCEGPSSVSEDSCETPVSYRLPAAPHQLLTSTGQATRVSPPPPVLRPQRFSLNSNPLNFSALEASDVEVSPRFKDKFDNHGPTASASEVNSPSYGPVSVNNDHPRSTPRRGRKFFKSQVRADSDPHIPSSSLHSSMGVTDDDVHRRYGSHSSSKSRSRAVSPLRFIHGLSTSLHPNRHRSENEEPFVPVNPFKSKIKFEIKTWFNVKSSTRLPVVIELGQASVDSASTSSNSAHDCDAVLVSSVKDWARHAHVFIVDALPRYIYLNLLLRLPALYFSRVARVFRDAEISRPDIERMTEGGEYSILPLPFDPQVDDRANFVFQQLPRHPSYRAPEGRRQQEPVKDRGGVPVRLNATAGLGMGTQVGVAAATPPHIPQEIRPSQIVTPALRKFKQSWEMFIDSLLREWKTLNVVSALLASAILTIFQIPDAAGDPVTRTAAILSLICSLLSLTYGCIYIVRFSTMRTMIRASKWAEEAQRTKTAILWNVWVLLAMPAVWLAWSMILFMVTIISFVWRTGSEADPEDGRPPLSDTTALGPRITVSLLAFIGFVYLVLIIRTLKSYGIHGGTSRNLLTSPSAQLQQVFLPQATPVSGERERGMRHGPLLEAAFERRGRERMRSVEPRRGRRREEVSEHREERAVQDKLVERNELGLYVPV